jgi:hypothetical protein
MAAQVNCRAIVFCPCGAMYALAVIHALDLQQPIGTARICTASPSLTPGTGSPQIEGQSAPLRPIASSDVALEASVTLGMTAKGDLVVGPGPASAQGGTCGPTVVIL